MAFADPRSESVGESRSRVAIARAGLPVPRPQLDVVSADGVVVGRCDFGWEELGVVGEFDGKVKYGRALLRPDQDPGDVVFEEKLREDALRDTGREVVRWVWAELRDFTPVVGRFERARSRAARRRRSPSRWHTVARAPHTRCGVCAGDGSCVRAVRRRGRRGRWRWPRRPRRGR